MHWCKTIKITSALTSAGLNGRNPEYIQNLLAKKIKSEQRKNDLVIPANKSVTCGDKRIGGLGP